MKSNLISARLDAAYLEMVDKLRAEGETDSEFVRRAIDALALLDEEFMAGIDDDESPLESQRDKYIY